MSVLLTSVRAQSFGPTRDDDTPVPDSVRRIRLLLLAFVAMWILEGAFRKWLPGSLGTPFYLVRDVMLALTFVIGRWRGRGLYRSRTASALEAMSTALIGFAALQALVRSLPIATFILGVRQFVVPLLFIAMALRFCDRQWGYRVLLILVCSAPLEVGISVLQALAPAESFINQAGPGEFTALTSSGEVVRASGTFSAAFGLFTYVTLALPAFLVLIQAMPQMRNSVALRRWIWFSGASLLVLPLVAGSRSITAFSVVLCLVYVVLGFSTRQFVKRLAVILVAAIVMVLIVLTYFSSVLTALGDRFENASQEESTSGRVVHLVIDYALEAPLYASFGDGLGTHLSATNVTADDVAVEGHETVGLPSLDGWIENETVRWAAEGGAVGLALAFGRQIFGLWMILAAFKLRRSLSLDGWVPWSIGLASSFVAGSINNQPTSQGFAAIGVAVLLVMDAERRGRTPAEAGEELPGAAAAAAIGRPERVRRPVEMGPARPL